MKFFITIQIILFHAVAISGQHLGCSDVNTEGGLVLPDEITEIGKDVSTFNQKHSSLPKF